MKNKHLLFVLVLFLVITMPFVTTSTSGIDKNKNARAKLRKPDIVDLVFVNYNNWSYVMRNNGSFMYDTPDKDQNGNNAGGEFPRGSGITIVYAGGIYIGALKNGIPVVSETEFATEFQPGRIVNSGVPFGQLKAEDPLLTSLKVHLIDRNDTKDWPEEALRDQFGNPVLIADAQTWAVFNDRDTSLNAESSLESPNPGLGIEVVMESYAFNGHQIGDVIYIRYILTNKTNTDYTQSYFGIWSDPDVDDSSNDIIGTDTSRSMMYVYNDDETDHNGAKALGFDLIQGPVVHVAQIPSRDMLRNQNSKSILIYDSEENRFVSKALGNNLIVLGAVSSGMYAGATDPVDNGERYNLMRGADKSSGIMKSGCGINDYFAFRGNPLLFPTGGSCDVAGLGSLSCCASGADQRTLIATGPFTIKAGESQEIWVGVVGAKGADRLDAVANLFATDDFAQSFFDNGFPAPSSPPLPELSVSSLDGKVSLTWKNNAEVSEDLSGELLGVSIGNGYTAGYVKNDFQGYRVYRSLTGLEGSFELLAQYDKVDSLGIITNRFINTNNHMEIVDVDLGSNTGLQYHFIDSNLINGQNYFYSVTAYDAQPYIAGPDSMLFDGQYILKPAGLPVSLESSLLSNVVSVVSARPFSSLTYDASLDSSRAMHVQGPGDGYVTLEIVDASKVKTLDYTIEFFKMPTDSNGGTLVGSEFLPADLLVYQFVAEDSVQRIDSRSDDPRTFYDKNSNGTYEAGTDIVLDESKFATSQALFNQTEKAEPLIIQGIKVTIFGPVPGVKRFLCVANGSGVLAVPDQAAFAFNGSGFPTRDGLPPDVELGNDAPQIPNLLAVPGAASVANGGKWGVHTGSTTAAPGDFDATYAHFLVRVMRNTNFTRFVPYDFEMRFTAGGSLGWWAFSDNSVNPIPFELWRVGIGTYADTTDDVQMVAGVLDDVSATNVYDMGQWDHSISGGDNDPYMDWVYWYIPDDQTPGRSGWNDFFFGTGGTTEVMARTVLVNFNAGQNYTEGTWPANVNQMQPATGTIFRIISTKPNAPGDVFTFSTTANSVTTSKSQLKKNLKNIKVVPNPFYKYSSYETNFDKVIKFTHLPDVCTIKIFTVAGDLIKTIKHNATSNNDRVNDRPYDEEYEPAESATSIERWDLKTANGRYVASGMYIALVESPAGKRFVKFAVIQ